MMTCDGDNGTCPRPVRHRALLDLRPYVYRLCDYHAGRLQAFADVHTRRGFGDGAHFTRIRPLPVDWLLTASMAATGQ